MPTINWNDTKSKISKYFTVKEATYLPSIGVYHTPSEEEKTNIVELALKLDIIRELISSPLVVHCWIRPTSVNCSDIVYKNFNYNAHCGSKALRSAHIVGKAVDFHVKGSEGKYGCDAMRGLILPQLEALKLRMEDITSDWIHLDTATVVNARFFKP